MITHVYVPDTSKQWIADEEGMSYVPCKLCGKGPGGEHRELESLVDSQHRRSETVVPEEES